MQRALAATDLLDMWESGRSQSVGRRALALLSRAQSGVSLEELSRLSIGRRDAQLLDLREAVFGSRMAGQAACPACGQLLELEFAVNNIRAASPAGDAQTGAFTVGDYEVSFRLPNTEDIEAIAPLGNVEARKYRLLQLCTLKATHLGQPIAAHDLPEEVIGPLSEHMARLDPQCDMHLALTCPQCAHLWQTSVDIVSFFWTELHAWAVRLLRDVHALASAYGWRESDILAMNPRRRQVYLDLMEKS